MQPPFGSPPSLQAPPARDPVTKLQILLGNLLKHFTEVVAHLSEVAPPLSISGTMEDEGAEEILETPSSAIKGALTREQLNDFVLGCSHGVGSLVHLIEEEMEKLPEGIQTHEEIQDELRYLERENEIAAAELKHLVASVRHFRDAVRHAYREAATEGTSISID
ncbi:uncharacterized protein LOC34620366 [Cyclospora cayetanensis]|uniref:Uncharacterized protein n=2 Tax=Cyclospora cayetanensis TaxID=88456 RepID=A0A1D3CXA7_9EIME|nr:uncharacterized protein LOC34620366 [Cyclospora cayetanensis]OEH75835.1 hypothetical protein cyc_03716 [Cyclospora cayetanensis]